MKRIILAALLLSVGISLLGAAPKTPVFVGTFPEGEIKGPAMVGGLGTVRFDKVSDPIGLGAGGWLEGGAIHPTNSDHVILGADVVNTYYSQDGGETFSVITKGYTSRQDIHRFYGMDAVGVHNSSFSGFIQVTSGGIFSFAINDADTFVCMTPHDDPEGLYVAEVSRGSETSPWGYWVDAIPFSSIYASPDNEYLVAGTGRYRFGLNGSYIGPDNYPNRYVTVNYANPAGRQGLWYYWYEDPNGPRWRPLDPDYDSWNPEHGAYNSVALGIAGTDTVVVMATAGAGPQMYNVTTKEYVDLAGFPWHSHTGATVAVNEWGTVITGTNNVQSCESIELSDRMTAYACLSNDDTDSPIKSGLYRMHDVLNPTAWEWVGDDSDMPWIAYTDSLTTYALDHWASGAGMAQRVVVNYVTMNEAGTNRPDTLWVGDRGYVAGLSRILVPYGEGVSYDQDQTWEAKHWLFNYQFEDRREPRASYPIQGWNEFDLARGITFEPMVNPIDANEVIIQDGHMLTKTTDGGSTWEMLSPKKPSSDLRLSTNNGYEEECTNDLALFSDGRLAISFGDNGLAISETADNWDELRNLNNEVAFRSDLNVAGADSCDTSLAGLISYYDAAGVDHSHLDPDLVVNSDETAAIHVEPDWDGTGRDAFFFVGSKRIGEHGMGNIIMYHDSDGDGDWETTSATKDDPANGIADRWRYAYFYDWAWVRSGDDVSVFIPYWEATTSACVGDWTEWGVHRLDFDSATDTWSRSDLNNFNDFEWGDTGYTTSGMTSQGIGAYRTSEMIVHSVAENKLYMGLNIKSSLGAAGYGRLYELDLDDVTPMWVEIMGYNSYTGDPADNRDWTRDIDFLRMSDDGTTLYIANDGAQSGYSGIWKLTDLDNDVLDDGDQSHPNWTLPTIEWMINNPTKTTAWSMFPPARYGELVTDRGRSLDKHMAQKDGHIEGILINPNDNDQIWYTVKNTNKLHTDRGLWAYDTSKNVLVHVLDEDDGKGVMYSDENLMLDTVHDPPRIIVGTDCVGVYWFNWDGVFHTDKGMDPHPMPDPVTKKEYPPNGVYNVNGDSQVTIYWNITPNYMNNGLTGYYVYRGDSEGGPYNQISGLINPGWSHAGHLNYVDTTAINGFDYYYVVTTEYGASEGEESLEVKAHPRSAGIPPGYSNEDFAGDGASAAAWKNGNFNDILYTAGPFGGPYEETTAQGFFCNNGGVQFSQQSAPSEDIYIPFMDDWLLYSAYVKCDQSGGLGNHGSSLRIYDENTVYRTVWGWEADETKITFGSGTNDGEGSYYVGNGWHRVWFILDLAGRGIEENSYDLRIVPYSSDNVEGYGLYVWGITVEFFGSEPTELCDAVPVLPIEGTLTTPPRYWGDENCRTIP